MLQKLTPKQSADHHINTASRLASIIFAAEQWTYSDVGYSDGKVPDAQDIEDKIRDLINGLNNEYGNISSGRISIEADEWVGYRVRLEIGSLTDEEFDSV